MRYCFWRAALLAALAASWAGAGEVPLPEGAGLVDIRSEPGLPALTFADMHGFEGTHHLAPVLLPAESRFSTLRSAREVQDALKLDPLLRDLSLALGRAVEEELGSLPAGRRLLESLGRPLPPILLAESKEMVGSYKTDLDAVALNWRDVRAQFAEAEAFDCSALGRWLMAEPARLRRLARDFAPILAHELAHTLQNDLFGLGAQPVPNGGRYLELEEEAYFIEMLTFLEAAEREPGLLSSDPPMAKKLAEELFVFVWDLDRYREAVREAYAPGERKPSAIPLALALRMQRRRLDEAPSAGQAALRRGLLSLERARRHYDRRIPELVDSEWPPLSVRGMLLFARRDLRRRPPLAMALVYRAAQRSREQDEIGGTRTFEERRSELERLFREAAWEDLRSLIGRKDGPSPSQVRGRYAELVGELCSELELDCKGLVRDVLERSVPSQVGGQGPGGP